MYYRLKVGYNTFMNVIEEVKKILETRVDVSTLKEDDPLTLLGLDSLDLVEIVLQIEDQFSIEFSAEEITNFKTFKDVIDSINKKLN